MISRAFSSSILQEFSGKLITTAFRDVFFETQRQMWLQYDGATLHFNDARMTFLNKNCG
jgi:hypothetical protein